MDTLSFLITGGAGFIGSHLSEKLLQQNHQVCVIDNFDNFYEKKVKQENISLALQNKNYTFIEDDINNILKNEKLLNQHFDVIIHLAAKAGVRPSIQDPLAYQVVNVVGTQYMLEFAKIKNIKKFIFASSSSVYGVNANTPWSENDFVLKPISPYASSKVSCELLGNVYSHLYNICFIGLRFFTVFGPRQRPDLAIYQFTKNIFNGTPVTLFGDGSTFRDYTFIEDIIDGIIAASFYTASNFEIINLGNNTPVNLAQVIESIEISLQKKAFIQNRPLPPGDVPVTYANIDKAKKLLNYAPKTSMQEGIDKFVSWYLKNRV
jgi:UDP-glucuronate 4-epimerase